MTMQTTTGTQQEMRCPKCGGRNLRREMDPVGITLHCGTCGQCTYLDQHGRPAVPEEKKLPAKPRDRSGTREPCPGCGKEWDQPYPRTGQREQCLNCGLLRPSGEEDPAGDPLARSTAAMLEMQFVGLSNAQMDRHAPLMQDGPPRRGNRSRWTRTARSIALETDGDLAIPGGEEWLVASAEIRDTDSRLVVIMDRDSQVILESQVCSGIAVDGEIFRRAARRVQNTPARITSNMPGNSVMIAANIHTPRVRDIRADSLENMARETRLGEFIRIARIRDRATRGESSRAGLQSFNDALAHDLNCFRLLDREGDRTPLEKAGVQPQYRDWETVAERLITLNQDNKAGRSARAVTSPVEQDPNPTGQTENPPDQRAQEEKTEQKAPERDMSEQETSAAGHPGETRQAPGAVRQETPELPEPPEIQYHEELLVRELRVFSLEGREKHARMTRDLELLDKEINAAEYLLASLENRKRGSGAETPETPGD